MPDAGFSIRGSGVGGATGTQGNYGVQSHQAGAAHGRVPGKASPNRPPERLIQRSSQVVAQVVADFASKSAKCWSEWQDLNLRPPRPERGALPDRALRSVFSD